MASPPRCSPGAWTSSSRTWPPSTGGPAPADLCERPHAPAPAPQPRSEPSTSTDRTPLTGETIGALHAEVETRARHLHVIHAERLHCAEGCSACCQDDLSVFEVEAAPIRAHHAALLDQGIPHAAGGCAFLDDAGACRIYEHRPYVCRTQGLPLRWLDERDGLPVELRDICPLNEEGVAVESIAEGDCFTLGPVEERLADMQYAAHIAGVSPAATPARATRTHLRALFVTK